MLLIANERKDSASNIFFFLFHRYKKWANYQINKWIGITSFLIAMSLCSLNSSESYTKNHTIIYYQKLLLMIYQFTNLLGAFYCIESKKLETSLFAKGFIIMGFPGGADGKESACSGGDPGSIPALRRFPGRGHGNQLQYSCLENPMDRGALQATIHGVTKSLTRLSDTFTLPY